ncbi:hypothetical protein OU800_07880 [Pseudomonas sp. GOM7]|uniref:hypothetical protein n=1 Tax=Pseudomonas sp. GOM7 TaxID=2998079 RepID=UPI00227A5FD6|nr:hypothetical protein [Pseudomonas sp. GOM7]WAJ39134.1 hypothetical protein OU800_07880 [Pseudomonas sp. GOM7]
MKHLAVTKFSCTSEFSSSEIELDIPGEKIECLRAELASLISKYGFEYQYGETHFLSTQKYSICNCSKCGHYMVNREANPAGLDLSDDTQIIVFDGALLNGVPLCEECLPEGHRWSVA